MKRLYQGDRFRGKGIYMYNAKKAKSQDKREGAKDR